MSVWKSPFKELPSNKQKVWIRVTSIYGELTVADYDADKKVFITSVTEINIPVFNVARWKVYP